MVTIRSAWFIPSGNTFSTRANLHEGSYGVKRIRSAWRKNPDSMAELVHGQKRAKAHTPGRKPAPSPPYKRTPVTGPWHRPHGAATPRPSYAGDDPSGYGPMTPKPLFQPAIPTHATGPPSIAAKYLQMAAPYPLAGPRCSFAQGIPQRRSLGAARRNSAIQGHAAKMSLQLDVRSQRDLCSEMGALRNRRLPVECRRGACPPQWLAPLVPNDMTTPLSTHESNITAGVTRRSKRPALTPHFPEEDPPLT